jgi:2-methylcitrate dehydratase PrpD
MQLVSSIAAALAARYYKLDAEKTKVALSYAATNATDPGNSYYDYCQEFKLHNGESARMGIIAAEMARGGWNGLEDPYFGHWGLITSKVGDGGLPGLYEKAFDALGELYFTEMRFKKGPGGIPTTATGEGGKLLREQIIAEDGVLDAEKIKQVRIYQSKNMKKNYYFNPFRHRNHVNALFSYTFAACCTLIHGDRRVDHVQTKAILENPSLIELAENAVMDVYDAKSDKMMMKAEAEMRDGRVFTVELDYNAQMGDYPTQEFLIKKFWDQFNAFGKLPKSTGEKIIELAGRVETLSDMREYTELLTLK